MTTVITADTQCRNVITNRNYESNLHYNPTIFKVGTVAQSIVKQNLRSLQHMYAVLAGRDLLATRMYLQVLRD